MKKSIQLAIKEAEKHLTGYGIDFAQYSKGKWEYWIDPGTGREDTSVVSGIISGNITWSHKKHHGKICMTKVYVNVDNGSIAQCGSNYGNLMY